MATPPEEIAQQHETASQLLFVMPCASPSSHEEIPLSMKTRPSIDLFPPEEDDEKKGGEEIHSRHNILTWSSRGHVDVSRLQALVTEGYKIAEHTPPVKKTSETATKGNKTATKSKQSKVTKKAAAAQTKPQYSASDVKSSTNLWDPINAAVHNVNIIRPSHDAWGIGKIVLIFADDFLKNIYELPWWHDRRDFQEALQPILETIGIQSNQIVRLLLASLPPGTTIPIHHDSGAWVSQTHRVHVPIIVKEPEKVLFRVGLTGECLERIDCTPGHVFEMNNQCRHAVSNCSDDYRVHMILDYTDTAVNERIILDAGERLLQTRRSVDRFQNQGSRPTPSFLILGAQKAGTTSLYEYMMQHPLIIRPNRRETHCLDWRWKEELTPGNFTDEELRAHCHLFYQANALKFHPSCCTGDSTPSYLLDSRRVIPRLKKVFPWRISFLIITRDPIQRAESHFAMVTSTEGTPEQLKTRGMEWREKTLAQVVHEELQSMHDCGLIPYWDLAKSCFDQSIFEAFVNTTDEDKAWTNYLERHVPLNTGSYGLLARGLYALQIRPWLRAFDPHDFLCLQLERDLDPSTLQATMKRVFDHVGVPSSFTLSDSSPKNTRQYSTDMDLDLYNVLQRFFEPHNKRWEALVSSLPK